MKRRALTFASLGALTMPGMLMANQPDDYPSRRITLVVPFSAGGALDQTARVLGEHIQSRWKVPVVIENRAGASGIIGAQSVARAKPDGYTLMLAAPSVASWGAFLKKPAVDVLTDLTPISLLVEKAYYVLVSSAIPARTLPEFIAYARQNPGKLNYGTFGGGNHLTLELFRQMTDLDMMPVHYKGEADVATAVASNEVQLSFGSIVVARPLIQTGKMRVLAVTTPNGLGQLPAVAETIPGFESRLWYGLMGPAGLPNPVIEKLGREVGVFLQRADIVKQLADIDYTPSPSSPEVFKALITDEVKRWEIVARRAGITQK